ncbi:MAG: 6-phosphofructokinase [Akkermansiaceae bacterium]|nr:6-phosphofructokinase [Akkermansiaceae bacterium]
MKRIGILTAGGDTPALNATIQGAVVRANQRRVEVFGFIKGFSSLLMPQVPHVHLNPLFTEIPELDPTRGGTVIGASRAYVDARDTRTLDEVADRMARLKIAGLICVGGDGTLNGLQPLAERFPTVLAPKTIDNDLGLNHRNEPDEWSRVPCPEPPGYRYERLPTRTNFDLEGLINYATPGYATSVFVSVEGVRRIRTTAESHRRIAIVEVMGRHAGFIALGAAYGQPDLVLIYESNQAVTDTDVGERSTHGDRALLYACQPVVSAELVHPDPDDGDLGHGARDEPHLVGAPRQDRDHEEDDDRRDEGAAHRVDCVVEHGVGKDAVFAGKRARDPGENSQSKGGNNKTKRLHDLSARQ